MNIIVNEALEEQRLNSVNTLEEVAKVHNFWVHRVAELDVASTATELQVQCALYGVIDEIAERLDEINTKMGKLKAVLQNKILPKGFETVDVPVQYVGNVEYRMATRVTGSFIDKELGYQWLEDIGEGGLVTRTVHSQTLSAFLKRYMEDNLTSPPENVRINTLEYVKRGTGSKANRARRAA